MRAGEVRGGERRRTAKELKRISNCHCQGDDDDARQAEGGDSEDGQTTGQGNVQLLGPCSRVPPWRLEAANAGIAVDVEWHLVSCSPAAASASSPALKSQHEHFLLSTSWTAATSSPSWGASSSSSASLCLCLVWNSRRGREGEEGRVEAALAARNVQVELLIIFVTNV